MVTTLPEAVVLLTVTVFEGVVGVTLAMICTGMSIYRKWGEMKQDRAWECFDLTRPQHEFRVCSVVREWAFKCVENWGTNKYQLKLSGDYEERANYK